MGMPVILKLMDKCHHNSHILIFALVTPCKRYTTLLLAVSYSAKQENNLDDLNRPLY